MFKIFEHHHVLHTLFDMSTTKFHEIFGFKSLNMSDFTGNIQDTLITWHTQYPFYLFSFSITIIQCL